MLRLAVLPLLVAFSAAAQNPETPLPQSGGCISSGARCVCFDPAGKRIDQPSCTKGAASNLANLFPSAVPVEPPSVPPMFERPPLALRSPVRLGRWVLE